MAVYNEINSGRFARALQKMTGIKGAVPMNQLAGELIPVVSIPYGVENRVLESWYRFAVDILIGPTAAQRNAIVLVPATNVVAVIEKFIIYGSGTVADLPTLTVNAFPTNRAAFPGPGAQLDGRIPQQYSLQLQTSGNAGAIAGTVFWKSNLPVNGQVEVITNDLHEIVLAGSLPVTLWSNTVNNALEASIWWRERFLEESERTA